MIVSARTHGTFTRTNIVGTMIPYRNVQGQEIQREEFELVDSDGYSLVDSEDYELLVT